MSRALIVLLAFVLVACPGPSGTDAGTDTGGTDGGGIDTGMPAGTWTESAPLPVELAHGAGIILTSGTTRWLFVVGGASFAADTIGTTSNLVYRAQINIDGSLGAWEEAGRIGSAMGIAISQHGLLRLTGEDLRQGIAIAGGMTGTGGEVPLVLATYVNDVGALDSPYGRFPPMIASGEGQWQMTFMPFDPHALALVGGLDDSGFTARVQIARIYLGVDVPDFVDGPALPAPRAAHSWARVDRAGANPDLYVVGGHNDAGSTDDVLRTTRNAMGEVDGWEVVGDLTSAPHGHGTAVLDGQLYVFGGRIGTTLTDRVRRARFMPDGHLARFEVVEADALPYPLAHAATVQDDVIVYLVGGISAGASTNRVLIGRF